MLQVVIPMAGLGTRFTQYGFKQNKYLLPINIDLQPMIELAITSINVNINIPCKYFFIINEEHGKDKNLRDILKTICKKYNYKYNISSVTKLTEGPASTVATIIPLLNPNDPLIVSNSDQVLYWDFDEFYNTSLIYDGCVLTYKPNYDLVIGSTDKHSFIHINETTNKIDQFAEKIVLSDKAIVGVHYYKNAQLFIDSYDYIVKNNIRAPNGEFYISLTYQALLELGYSVGYHDLAEDEEFCPVGEPDDYFTYLYSNGGYIHNVYPLKLTQCNTIVEIVNNDSVLIQYIKCNPLNQRINYNNQGLLVLVSGDINIPHKQWLNKNDITNYNIKIMAESEFITIEFKNNSIDIMNNLEKQIWNTRDFIRGWFIGNFTPSIVKTTDFEVAIIKHSKEEKWDYHYHVYADEINILLEGSMLINNKQIYPKDVFTIKKKQLTCPIFLEDCYVLCIKVPSVIGDKICV